jgi:hypothetical protein
MLLILNDCPDGMVAAIHGSMKISKQAANSFHVIADAETQDSDMVLRGRELRSHESRGDVRLRTMRVKLGPKSYARIVQMAIGETLFF